MINLIKLRFLIIKQILSLNKNIIRLGAEINHFGRTMTLAKGKLRDHSGYKITWTQNPHTIKN